MEANVKDRDDHDLNFTDTAVQNPAIQQLISKQALLSIEI